MYFSMRYCRLTDSPDLNEHPDWAKIAWKREYIRNHTNSGYFLKIRWYGE